MAMRMRMRMKTALKSVMIPLQRCCSSLPLLVEVLRCNLLTTKIYFQLQSRERSFKFLTTKDGLKWLKLIFMIFPSGWSGRHV